jgi:hypothetical protein
MVRTQIQLTDKLSIQVKELAARECVSMAEMIRRALTHFLETTPRTMTDDRYLRAMAVAGRFRSGNRRLSTAHDAAFTEAADR